MLTLKCIVFAAILSMICGFSIQAQNKQAAYTDYDRGYYYWYYDKWDSSFLLFNRYVNNNPGDSLKKASAYKFMGEIQWYFSDLYGAQENLSAAIKTLNPDNQQHHEELSYVYNDLGNISLDLHSYPEAINFYNNAMNFAKGTGFIYEVINGKATALQKSERYNEAIALYDSLLSTHLTDQALLARLIDNRANTWWLQNPANPVLPGFWTALRIRTDSQYQLGLITSYDHMADYYEKPNPDSALWYAKKMFLQAKEIRRPHDMLDAIDKLVTLSNSPASKQYWYQQFKILNDSLQASKDTTRNRFAFIRYDFQKTKADNLVLHQHIFRQRLLTYSVILFAIAVIISLIMWYRKRRMRIKEEAAKSIQESKLKTSQKVHDVVANGLYGLMNELEHKETFERETIISKVEELYEKSRDISYEDKVPVEKAGFTKQIHDLLTVFSNNLVRVIIIGNEPTYWNKFSSKQQLQLKLVLNELMVNMTKHSQAKNVVIQFKQEFNNGLILYKDDGIGFDQNQSFGNGLHNTVNRIHSINGQVNFENRAKAGIAITISFPQQPGKP